MRVIFFGTSAFAVPCLERLATRHDVVLCVTRPDRPQGRGLKAEPSPVKHAAARLRLPILQPPRPEAKLFASHPSELGVVVAYGQIIRKELLELPQHGMLGVHPSLLPKYRGAAPIAEAIYHGETTTGVTIFRLSERLDDGDIVLQRSIAIEPHEDAQHLSERLAQQGADALLEAMQAVVAGQGRFIPQDHAKASIAAKWTKSQGRVDWHQSAAEIERLVRAAVPWPGAMTELHGVALKLWTVRARPELSSGSSQSDPGAVVRADPEGIVVAAGQGQIVILELQPAGKRKMSAKEFLAGHRVSIGEQFGTQDSRHKRHNTSRRAEHQ